VKIENNKYYTPDEVAQQCIEWVYDYIDGNDITEWVEPAAGSGSFSKKIIGCKAYDIEPEDSSIIKQDYLTLEETYKKGRIYIGNPPFGNRNSLSLKFLKKNMFYGDYIAYIQPILSLGGSLQFYEFDLVFSRDLGIINFSGVKLHCCYNIWQRRKDGLLNKKPNHKLNSVIIKEYRRNKKNDNDHFCYNVNSIDKNYDYAMCNWGSGTLGKVPEYVGQYAQEVYFYLKDKSKLPLLKQLLEYNTIRSYCKNISMKRLCVSRIYIYLYKNGFI